MLVRLRTTMQENAGNIDLFARRGFSAKLLISVEFIQTLQRPS